MQNSVEPRMAVERILQQEGEDAWPSPADIAFLNEYRIAMKPVVKALKILQSETNAYMGWLLPSCDLPATSKAQNRSFLQDVSATHQNRSG
ncbi:hypothetical protein SRHO_G00129220 [Serrasalmus rhombeus]